MKPDERFQTRGRVLERAPPRARHDADALAGVVGRGRDVEGVDARDSIERGRVPWRRRRRRRSSVPIAPVSGSSPSNAAVPPATQTPVIAPADSSAQSYRPRRRAGRAPRGGAPARPCSCSAATRRRAAAGDVRVDSRRPPRRRLPLPPACPTGMITIPGGEFFMGSSEPRALDNEKPAHQVTLSPYCIDAAEVTVAAYKACSDPGECSPRGQRELLQRLDDLKTRARRRSRSALQHPRASRKAQHPINCVDWEQAANYCRDARQAPADRGRVGVRGARSGRPHVPVGRRAAERALPQRVRQGVRRVGQEEPPRRRRDVRADVRRGRRLRDDRARRLLPEGQVALRPRRRRRQRLGVGRRLLRRYTKDAQKDPTGPKAGEDDRVIRGGAWNGSDPSWVRPTFRFHFPPNNRSYGIGFRCAATPK